MLNKKKLKKTEIKDEKKMTKNTILWKIPDFENMQETNSKKII